jgi:hypothetical protein
MTILLGEDKVDIFENTLGLYTPGPRRQLFQDRPETRQTVGHAQIVLDVLRRVDDLGRLIRTGLAGFKRSNAAFGLSSLPGALSRCGLTVVSSRRNIKGRGGVLPL